MSAAAGPTLLPDRCIYFHTHKMFLLFFVYTMLIGVMTASSVAPHLVRYYHDQKIRSYEAPLLELVPQVFVM